VLLEIGYSPLFEMAKLRLIAVLLLVAAVGGLLLWKAAPNSGQQHLSVEQPSNALVGASSQTGATVPQPNALGVEKSSTSAPTTSSNEGSGTTETELMAVATSKGPPPTQVKNDALYVMSNDTNKPGQKVYAITKEGFFDIPSTIDKVFIEVGTNDEPEYTALVLKDPNSLLIGFEPQPPVFRKMIRKFPKKNQLMAIPAAITPSAQFVDMNIAEHTGCSSMMNMNPRLTKFAHKQQKNAPRKSAVIQLRTIEFCTRKAETIKVPSFPLRDILKRIPQKMNISILSTDAQGYDLFVVSTIGKEQAKRLPLLVVECQDLTPGHTMMLVDGAPNCMELKKCIQQNFPHVLHFCWDNAPKARELNCLYRHPELTTETYQLPPGIKIVSANRPLVYPAREDFVCPNFLA
jgi:FkbM family methyltransferase